MFGRSDVDHMPLKTSRVEFDNIEFSTLELFQSHLVTACTIDSGRPLLKLSVSFIKAVHVSARYEGLIVCPDLQLKGKVMRQGQSKCS